MKQQQESTSDQTEDFSHMTIPLPRAYRLDVSLEWDTLHQRAIVPPNLTQYTFSNFETPGKYVQRRQSSNESNEGQDYYLCAKSFGILNGN